MNRRHFFASIPLVFTSCQSRTIPPTRNDRIARETHLAMVANYRVPPNAVRTTPKAPIDVVERFPELKPLVKVALRLHPRFGDEPRVDESKLGGSFLFPANEEWPLCPEFRIPMQAVLQVRAEDLPPQFPMRPTCDLFQLFWTPRGTKAGPPHVIGVWRDRAAVKDAIPNPTNDTVDLGFVPVPCRLFPERVSELPPTNLMPKQMRDKVEAWQPPVPYSSHLAAARGTKLGGWPGTAVVAPKCSTCVHPMDYLLTVGSSEWTSVDVGRWKPIEDRDEDGFRCAMGFDFGKPDVAMLVYVCRRCEKWPLRVVMT